MKCAFMLTVSAFALFCGCRVVEVENHGEAVLLDEKGRPVVVNNKPVTYSRGWSVYHNQHWMITGFDSLDAHINPDGGVGVGLNGYNAQPSAELRLLVEASLKGAAELAAKIGAAIASSGGSVGAETIAGWVKNYIAAGGDVNKATVTCAGGNCSFSDGSVTCINGACSEK